MERWRHGYGYVRPGTSLYKKSNKLDFSYRVRVPLIFFALAFSFSTVHQPYRVGERVGRQILEGRKEEMTHRFTRRGRVHTGGGISVRRSDDCPRRPSADIWARPRPSLRAEET